MFRKAAIAGFLLLVLGTSVLAWVYNDQNNHRQQQEELQSKQRADLDKLDELVGEEIDISSLDGFVYKEEAGLSLEQARELEERRGLLMIFGGVFALSGGSLLILLLLSGIFSMLFSGVRGSFKLLRGNKGDVQVVESEVQSQSGPDSVLSDDDAQGEKEKSLKSKMESFKSNFGRSGNSGIKDDTVESAVAGKDHGEQKGEPGRHVAVGSQAPRLSDKMKKQVNKPGGTLKRDAGKSNSEKETTKTARTKVDEHVQGSNKMAVLLSDAESVELEEPVKVDTEGLLLEMSQSQESEKRERLEDLFKARTEELEKKMSRVKQMAGKNVARQPSDHVEASIQELTQQVSAIREYASNQQERVNKLQDGYDWNIIKNFCIRVIRCIDNLDSRMERLSKNKVDTSDLEEVRDELVFALESTGVEQFEPELKSDYRGQEKNTEAVKEKTSCKDKKMAGKIAKVIKVGYQYAIDEDNFKVVRAAQVKLYG